MPKEFYIRCKQQQYEQLQAQVDILGEQRANFVEEQKEVIKETNRIVSDAINKVADTEMKKSLSDMHY